MKKNYTKQEILDMYNKRFTKDQKIQTLYDALDFMQQYNGRTKIYRKVE